MVACGNRPDFSFADCRAKVWGFRIKGFQSGFQRITWYL